MSPTATFIGKNLIELDLINRLSIQVISVTKMIPKNVIMTPSGRFVIKNCNLLVLLEQDKALAGQYNFCMNYLKTPSGPVCLNN